MPTTYTHDIFGKEVYKRLPSEIKEAIGESKSMYLIGLHGPDILLSAPGEEQRQRTGTSGACKGCGRVFLPGCCEVPGGANRADALVSSRIWLPLYPGQHLPPLCAAV